MVTEITEDIKVSLEAEYKSAYSSPSQHHYVFTYQVTICNENTSAVQLLSRHWHIHDVQARKKEVEGKGVIGQQPILEPGDSYQYVSGCNLKSGIGKMYGTYLMKRIIDGKNIKVNIPEFSLIASFKLN